MKRLLLVILLALCIAEIYLEFGSPGSKVNSYMNSILANVWSHEKDNIAMPPFVVILNKDWDDKKRLEDIYRYAKWPASTDYVASDFLRYKYNEYKIHINSLGFRGREVDAVKPKDTFRILAYGAYMTFGQGVNDDETYLSQAEHLLNERLQNKKVEILNGGMECGTFIMGLSRLHHELESTNADAVMFEYGFVDEHQVPHDKVPDNYNTLIGHPELEPYLTQTYYERFKAAYFKWYRGLEVYLYKSKLYTGFREKVLQDTGDAFPVGFSEMQKALTEASKNLAAKGKKVFLVVHPGLSKAGIDALTAVALETGAILVNGKQIFKKNPPTQQMLADFDNDDTNFLREIGFNRPDVHWRKGLDFKVYAPYYQNLFQLSPLGHQTMGEGLADSIGNYLKVPQADKKLR